MDWTTLVLLALAIAVAYFGYWFVADIYHVRTLRRRWAYINDCQWPDGLLDKLSKQHPNLDQREFNLVSSALKQFFRAYHRSGYNYVSMPSQAADDLWHEFILYTREYKRFCDRAFGRFLHHTPAAVLKPEQVQGNEGLQRMWWHTCRDETINPKNPEKLPLIFALDAMLKVPDGFHYQRNCAPLRKAGVTNVHCAADLAAGSNWVASAGSGRDGSGSFGGHDTDGLNGGGDGSGGCGGGGCGGGD